MVSDNAMGERQSGRLNGAGCQWIGEPVKEVGNNGAPCVEHVYPGLAVPRPRAQDQQTLPRPFPHGLVRTLDEGQQGVLHLTLVGVHGWAFTELGHHPNAVVVQLVGLQLEDASSLVGQRARSALRRPGPREGKEVLDQARRPGPLARHQLQPLAEVLSKVRPHQE